jgi:hypothetical protein
MKSAKMEMQNGLRYFDDGPDSLRGNGQREWLYHQDDCGCYRRVKRIDNERITMFLFHDPAPGGTLPLQRLRRRSYRILGQGGGDRPVGVRGAGLLCPPGDQRHARYQGACPSAQSNAILGAGTGITGFSASYAGLACTTPIISSGFRYFETTNQSLTQQFFSSGVASLAFGRLRSPAAISSIASGFLVWLGGFSLNYLKKPCLAIGLLGFCTRI